MEDKVLQALETTQDLLAKKHEEFEAFKTKAGELNKEADERYSKLAADIVDLQEKNKKLEAATQRPGSSNEEANELALEGKSALNTYLKTGNDTSLRNFQAKAMNTQDYPNGGILVPVEQSNIIISKNFESTPMRDIATVITTSSKSIGMLIDDNETAATWQNERGSRSQTNTPALGELEITAHEIYADPVTTLQMLEDSSIDVAAWLAGKVADKFSRTENTAFARGTGNGQPRGILSLPNYDAAGVYQRGCVEQIKTGSSTLITYDGLHDMQNAVKEIYQPNAVWGFKRVNFGAVGKIKDSQNRPLFGLGLNSMTGEQELQLLGKPVVFMDDLDPVSNGAGAKVAVYGDFKAGYTIVDRIGMTVLRDPYTNKGFMTFFFRKRTGGDVTNFESFKIQVVGS